MALISVDEARSRILAEATPVGTECVALMAADGRTLAAPLAALRTQPPFDASAMDGYAVRSGDVAALPACLKVIGEAAAGRGFRGQVEASEAVRIFTGAPVPAGADAIVIQEDTKREGDNVIVHSGAPDPGHVRQRGFDFIEGQKLICDGTCLTARDVTLAAAMGHAQLEVRRKPRVALIATGDELVLPGEICGEDQIVCSNPYGIAAMVRRAGGEPQFLGIARDDAAHLRGLCEQAAGAEILVTIGGASVGDHDIVAPVLKGMGMSLDFWRIAMRPGKPLMFGRLDHTLVIGLPGNPVSSLICTRVFIVPLIRALLGQTGTGDRTLTAPLAVDLPANGPRQHYMRAITQESENGVRAVAPVRSQDSSLLSPLATADVLIVRPAGDPAQPAGARVRVLDLDF